jgi:hypothetical protein
MMRESHWRSLILPVGMLGAGLLLAQVGLVVVGLPLFTSGAAVLAGQLLLRLFAVERGR